MNIPYFGPVDPFNLEDDYPGGLTLRGEEVSLDLNFDGNWIDPAKLQVVKKILGRLVTMDEKSRKYLHEEFLDKDGTTVRYYLEFHLEKVWRRALKDLIDFNDQVTTPIEQLLKQLHLIRVGFYPENEDVFAVFDYCIGLDYTEYVIAVNFNEKGDLQELTMEL